MKFEWFVARRYLRSPYRPAVLRLVTAFSVIGVAAGVATLVIALAMNTGFRETLQDRLLGVTAHVSLSRPGLGGIRDYDALASKLAATPITEKAVTRRSTAGRYGDRKYRLATNHSNFILNSSGFRALLRIRCRFRPQLRE